MSDLLGVVKQMMQPDRHTDAIRVLGRLTAFFRDRDNEFLLTRFACYEAIGVAIGEAGNVQAADHLIEDILYWKFQYPDIQRRHRRVGDDGQPVPPAQDPLLDAHHRVQPGAVRAPCRRPQRPAQAGRRLHRRHRPLPARRHALPQRRHPADLLRRQAAAPHSAGLLQRGGGGGRAARRLHPDRRDLQPARHAHALPAQAGARRVVQPYGRLQLPGAALLAHARHGRARALRLGQHAGGDPRRARVGAGPARRPGCARRGGRRRRPGRPSKS